MIVFSDSLVLVDPTTQFSLANPIIGYNNIVIPSQIAASSEDASGFYPATNMANPATNLKWKAAGDADATIIITNLDAVDLEYIGIARHNLGTIKSTISVDGSTDGGSTYSEALIDPFMQVTDDPIVCRFTKANYTNLRITLASNSDVPQIAVIYCGALLTLQRRIYVGHTPITLGRSRSNVNGMSESGQFLGRLFISQGRATAVSMKNLTPDWYRTYFDPFVDAAGEIPFFFAWRPEDYPDEVGYCWLAADPKPVNQASNGMMSVDLSFGGLG